MTEVYVDHAATTKISETAMAAMVEAMQETYGNPSSVHQAGRAAKRVLQNAREKLAACLGCTPKEIYFTSGGTEADNQAIVSAARLGAEKGKKHILSTVFEHHAVLGTLERLKGEGFEVELLPVDSQGMIQAEQVKAAIRPDTCLVTIMYANNEIGTLQPIGEIGKVCQEAGVLFHTDAVQAAGHVPINVKEQQIDLLSLSAHKFHGPKGIGVLYANGKIPLTRLMEGGGQERGKRPGTENVPAIAGMAAALTEACEQMQTREEQVRNMREHLLDGLLQIPHCVLNGDREKRLSGNINLCLEDVEGESLLLLLDSKGICASSGSACASGALEPSHVLLALGRPYEIAFGSLRLTLDASNTDEEIAYMLEEIPETVAYLRSMSQEWLEKENGEKEFVL